MYLLLHTLYNVLDSDVCMIMCDLRLVQYESADSAERALLELQDSLLDGRRLFLRKVCQFQLYHNSSLKEIYGYY